jgi:putative FmdB family regulatory protein
MPTYDYKCTACNLRFEEFQSMKDKPLKKCPACGKYALERLIGTGAALIFKGSGFYQTDYRTESYKKGAEADAPPSKSGDAAASEPGAKPGGSDKGAVSETKVEAKPAPVAPASKPTSKPPKRKSKSE